MEKTRILIVGARGYLGTFLRKYAVQDREIQSNFEVIQSARDKKHLSNDLRFVPIDILEENSIQKGISEVNPDIIINCAAISLPDLAEDERELTYNINVVGVENLIKACKTHDIKLIHISTDYVFSGEKGDYKEDDEPSPVNYYGYTKLEAEKKILSSDIDYLICRTAVLYGLKEEYQRRNIFYSYYLPLKENKKVQAAKQIGSVTLVDDLALALYKMASFTKSGIYHTAGPEPISRYEFAKTLADVFGFDASLIEEIPQQKRKAKRPQNSSLNVEKLFRDFHIRFRNAREGLEFIKNNL
ncbi:MAG: SDR family oxidoreductase [Promethearchaeota archaeon]